MLDALKTLTKTRWEDNIQINKELGVWIDRAGTRGTVK